MFDGTLVKRIFRVEIAERNADRGKRAVEAHSVRGLGADTEALLIGRRGLANDGAFAVDQPGGRNARVEIGSRILDVALGGLDGRVRAVEAAGFGHAFGPRGLIDLQLPRLCKGDDGFLLAEVICLRRRLHLLQFGLLLRVGGKGGFVSLVGCGPKGRAKSGRVIIDGGLYRGAIPATSGTVGLVISDSNSNASDALMGMRGAFRGAKLCLGLIVVNVFNAVLDKEWLSKARQLQLSHTAIEFREHGFEEWVLFGLGASLLGSSGHRPGEGTAPDQ